MGTGFAPQNDIWINWLWNHEYGDRKEKHVTEKLQKTVSYSPEEFYTSFVVTRKNEWVFKGKYRYFTAVSVYKKLCPF